MTLPKMKPSDVPLYQCRDCGVRADDYVVHDRIWYEAFEMSIHAQFAQARKPRGHLCFECLETRLKRPLRSDDFRLMPINRGILLGLAMARREVEDSSR